MNKSGKYFLILAVLLTATSNLLGQVPVVETPKPATLFTVPSYTNPTPQVRHPSMPEFPPYNPNTLDMYKRDRQEVQRRNAEIYRSLQEHSISNYSIQYEFPSQFGAYGTGYYLQALEKTM